MASYTKYMYRLYLDDFPDPTAADTYDSIHDPNSPKLIYLVCGRGDLDKVRSLVADQDRSQDYLAHGLFAAARYGREKVVAFLLANGAPPTYEALLFAAKESKSTAIFQLFLEHGYNINLLDEFGSAIMPHIVDNEDLVKFFVEHGADPNIGTSDRLQPNTIETAAMYASLDAVQLLVQKGHAKVNNGHPLHMAAAIPRQSRRPIMQYLLDKGCDVNQLDDLPVKLHIGAPLHWAVLPYQEASEHIKLLIEKGADISLKNRHGETPLDLTQQNDLGNHAEDIVRLLRR